MIPEALHRYPGIGAGEKLCWGRLARYEGRQGSAFPSMRTLGAELGVSARQARHYVAELERNGFIRRERVSGRSNRFSFIWHPVLSSPRKSPSALPGQDSSAVPRQTSSALGGTTLPPKRVSGKSRRQENQSEEGQVAQAADSQGNSGNDPRTPTFASEKDELIALIRDSSGTQPDARLIRQIPEFLELRGGTLKEYLEDIRPRLNRLRQQPGPAFFYRHAKQWGGESSTAAPEPKLAGDSKTKCSCQLGQVQTESGQWQPCQECDLGRELARANARLAQKKASGE
jgi:hypothetical protein